ncbi:MAG: PEP-CTERM sorting domain-containing protein [Nitrospinae bacterium]|nr:PEP-CTERM sorting domain-containing protein [Nitrospinota bacterium]
MLTFDLFANDQSGTGPLDLGLDHTAFPNQHVRVDILSFGSSAFDTGGGVLLGVLSPFVDPLPNPNPFTSYAFDITGLVGGGGTFDLRFGEVDNQGNFHMGVDNVSISAVPEPSTMLLLGSGLAGLVAWRMRKAKA